MMQVGRNLTEPFDGFLTGKRSGIDNRLIEPDHHPESTIGAIDCAQRLGGMLRFYHRAAA